MPPPPPRHGAMRRGAVRWSEARSDTAADNEQGRQCKQHGLQLQPWLQLPHRCGLVDMARDMLCKRPIISLINKSVPIDLRKNCYCL